MLWRTKRAKCWLMTQKCARSTQLILMLPLALPKSTKPCSSHRRSVPSTPNFQYIHTCTQRAVDALYSDDLMTRFYSRSSQTSTVYPEAVKSFSLLLDSLQNGGKHAVNILEVGAGTLEFGLSGTTLTLSIGTGLLTKYLVEELQRKPQLLAEYTVTDASYVIYLPLSFRAFLTLRVGLGCRARPHHSVQQSHTQAV